MQPLKQVLGIKLYFPWTFSTGILPKGIWLVVLLVRVLPLLHLWTQPLQCFLRPDPDVRVIKGLMRDHDESKN